jgi:hypothetical protein
VTEAQQQFGNLEEEKDPPLEALTKGLVKTQLTAGTSLEPGRYRADGR